MVRKQTVLRECVHLDTLMRSLRLSFLWCATMVSGHMKSFANICGQERHARQSIGEYP